MFNLFQNETDDFQFLLDNAGYDIQINSQPSQAVITNTPVNPKYDDKKIKTLSSINRGNKITYQNEVYLVISEVNGNRYGKYKGLMRKTNYTLPIKVSETKVYKGTDSMGRPVYDTIPTYSNEECIIANQTASVVNGAISLPDGNIDISFQDNDVSRLVKLNDNFTIAGQLYAVIGFDNTQVGLLIVKCQKTT